jgi:putative SOS response-associated peptidase YedK
MCTRYVLLKEHLREMLLRLGLDDDAAYATRYNIAPMTRVPAVRTKPKFSQRESLALRWGLVPPWAKEDVGFKMVNARSETLAEKPAFRDALKKRRCVIPVSGYYEWQTVGSTKLPWLFQMRDERPFLFAGLWESWPGADGAPLETCTVITTTPNELASPIHDRMPVVLDDDAAAAWLDPRETDAAKLAPLLQIFPAAKMAARAVSRFVSNVRHEGPECLAPAGAEDADNSPQLSLGLE